VKATASVSPIYWNVGYRILVGKAESVTKATAVGAPAVESWAASRVEKNSRSECLQIQAREMLGSEIFIKKKPEQTHRVVLTRLPLKLNSNQGTIHLPLKIPLWRLERRRHESHALLQSSTKPSANCAFLL